MARAEKIVERIDESNVVVRIGREPLSMQSVAAFIRLLEIEGCLDCGGKGLAIYNEGDANEGVQRCDTCKRFDSDAAARKAGTKLRTKKIFPMPEAEYREGVADNYGICIFCSAVNHDDFYEPDAEGGICEECGHIGMMAFENALIHGSIEFTDALASGQPASPTAMDRSAAAAGSSGELTPQQKVGTPPPGSRLEVGPFPVVMMTDVEMVHIALDDAFSHKDPHDKAIWEAWLRLRTHLTGGAL